MKVQVNVNDELVARIDTYCSQLGISRSAFCAMAIGQYALTYDRAFDTVERIAAKALETNAAVVE